MEINDILGEVLKNPKSLEVLSKKTWLSTNDTKSSIAKALPMILSQLEKNASDSTQKWLLAQAIEKKHSWEILDNLEKLDLNDWDKIISHLFWWEKSKIEKKVWNSSVLKALWPIVLGALWKKAKLSNSWVWNILWTLSWSSKWVNSILVWFLDKNGDWDIKDDLFRMVLNWIKRKFLWR